MLVIPPGFEAQLYANAPIEKREAYARHVSLSIDNGLRARGAIAVDK